MRWSLLLLCAAGVSACSQTVLVHSDGRPFHVQEPIQTFDGGWIAVDSCASGYHALLEIETEAEPSFPLMPFLLAPIGFCIGVLSRERGRVLALSFCMIPLALVYVSDFLGESALRVMPWTFMGWLPAMVILILGVPFCWRLLRV